jgi:hypothetical protein
MLTSRSSKGVIRWLTQYLGAVHKRKARHGALYIRTCPLCRREVRITVPEGREHLCNDTVGSICRQAHVTMDGLPDCPFEP